jgi:hypothetical protein
MVPGMNRKSLWLFTGLLLSGVNFAEAQQPVKLPAGIKLDWEDTSDNEKGFRIYRVTPKGKTKIAEVGPNVTTYIDKTSLSNACYVVTAFNSAGESDPSNTSCLNSSAAKRLCEIELNPNGLKLLSEVEQTFNKQVRDQWSKDLDRPAAGLITPDGTPTIRCHQPRRDLNEERIVHELSHLKLRAAGFPTIEFNGIERNLSQWIEGDIYDSIQHWITYPYLRKLGYSPDAARKSEVKRAIAENRFTDEPLPPSDIISRYLRFALESSDPLLLDQFREWYLRRDWDAQLKKARSLVQFIKDTNPTTGDQAVQSLIDVANVLFEPYLTFQVEQWQAKQLGSVVDRHVVIRALPRSGSKGAR